MCVGGVYAQMGLEKKRFLKHNSQSRGMAEKEVAVRPSGLSVLKPEELVDYEGQCLGIVEGKVKFHGTNAEKVLKELIQCKSEDKVFTSVPKSNVTLVK